MPALHEETQNEHVPRLVEALTGKQVIAAAVGTHHTAVWTKAGELFTFGNGGFGQPGHEVTQHEHVPKLVEAMAGKKVIGASAGSQHTVFWTEPGELLTFGDGYEGQLGHEVSTEFEHVPRLIDALAGKKVIGAAAARSHTAVWTDAEEIFTF